MMYSCALWGPEQGGVRGDLDFGPFSGDLEAAQLRKIRHVLRKARVKRGDRILEVGSGWGGLAIEAALTYGCEVDTLTLSAKQKSLAEERIEMLGLQDRVRVHLLDYRELPPEWEKKFDAFISVEMLEVRKRCHHTTIRLNVSPLQHVGSQVRLSVEFKFNDRSPVAVIPQHYNTYFKLVDWALKSENATAVVTSSTFPESRYSGYQCALSAGFSCTK
jgi:cyclopropane-fatty-acyl-phospholipid synthase